MFIKDDGQTTLDFWYGPDNHDPLLDNDHKNDLSVRLYPDRSLGCDFSITKPRAVLSQSKYHISCFCYRAVVIHLQYIQSVMQ